MNRTSIEWTDWSANPLVAAYFAVEREGGSDGAIYVCEMKKVADKARDPSEEEDVARFQPPAITERIVRQAGLFTVHPHPERDFEPEDAWQLTIPMAKRREMKRELFKLGFSRGALFPGLDGVAADSTWEGSGIY